MAALADTNVLVYRHDGRFPDRQERATEVLPAGISDGSVLVAHQAIFQHGRLYGTVEIVNPFAEI